MKILNIHGYKGSSENCAFSALSRLGCEIVSPKLDYDAVSPEEVITELRDILSTEDIELIVGTSLGGFYAAVLAAETGLPVLLVNPCLMPFYHLPKLGYAGDIKPFIALFGKIADLDVGKAGCIVGGSDEVIDTHSFAEALFGGERFRVVPDGRHSGGTLPLPEFFGEMLNFFR